MSVIDADYGATVPSMREVRVFCYVRIQTLQVIFQSLQLLIYSQVNPGLYECTFVPKHDGDHFVNVGVRGVAVPGSPFPVIVSLISVFSCDHSIWSTSLSSQSSVSNRVLFR